MRGENRQDSLSIAFTYNLHCLAYNDYKQTFKISPLHPTARMLFMLPMERIELILRKDMKLLTATAEKSALHATMAQRPLHATMQ